VLEPLTPEGVHSAEELLGIKLPAEYIDLLQIQNGGYIRYKLYLPPVALSWVQRPVMVEYIHGIEREPGGGVAESNILDSPRLVREWQLPDRLVLIGGDAYNWIALDYRTSDSEGEPSVLSIDLETRATIELAPNFRTFVERLVDGNTYYVFGLCEVADPPQLVIQTVTNALGTAFMRMPRHPYFQGEDIEWQEYRAIDDKCFLLPNWSILRKDFRYPTHKECNWLLSCDITKEEVGIVEASLAEHLPYSVVLIHTPHFPTRY
jgi:hypothetical protein